MTRQQLCCEGRPLILVAGQGATLGVWTPDLLKNLAQGRKEVTIFDNRRIGFSTDSDEEDELTVESYAESTVDLIDALALDQPDVLGWSLGGFITLTIAVNYGGMVHSVVVADTSSGGSGLHLQTSCAHSLHSTLHRCASFIQKASCTRSHCHCTQSNVLRWNMMANWPVVLHASIATLYVGDAAVSVCRQGRLVCDMEMSLACYMPDQGLLCRHRT